jgi:hypothetical protein
MIHLDLAQDMFILAIVSSFHFFESAQPGGEEHLL